MKVTARGNDKHGISSMTSVTFPLPWALGIQFLLSQLENSDHFPRSYSKSGVTPTHTKSIRWQPPEQSLRRSGGQPTGDSIHKSTVHPQKGCWWKWRKLGCGSFFFFFHSNLRTEKSQQGQGPTQRDTVLGCVTLSCAFSGFHPLKDLLWILLLRDLGKGKRCLEMVRENWTGGTKVRTCNKVVI